MGLAIQNAFSIYNWMREESAEFTNLPFIENTEFKRLVCEHFLKNSSENQANPGPDVDPNPSMSHHMVRCVRVGKRVQSSCYICKKNVPLKGKQSAYN